MGKNNQSKQAEKIGQQAGAFQSTANTNYNNAVSQSNKNYGDIMSGYGDISNNLTNIGNRITSPTPYTPQTVNYSTPGELTTAYGTLGSAGKTFQDFADTGGFSAGDIANLRARGMSPITSAYGNTIEDLQQANRLGGGAANYVAARSAAQRELPQQLSDAEQGVNANLAQMIQQGKLAGAQGLLGVGGEQGGLANTAEAQALGAAIANQGAGLQGAALNNQMNQEYINNLLSVQQGKLAAQQGRTGLYGTTPGAANMFGNQVLGSLNTEVNANKEDTSQPWYDTALGIAGDVLPFFSGGFGGGGDLSQLNYDPSNAMWGLS